MSRVRIGGAEWWGGSVKFLDSLTSNWLSHFTHCWSPDAVMSASVICTVWSSSWSQISAEVSRSKLCWSRRRNLCVRHSGCYERSSCTTKHLWPGAHNVSRQDRGPGLWCWTACRRDRTWRHLTIYHNKKAELSQRWPRDAPYMGALKKFESPCSTPTITFPEILKF